MKIIVNKKDTKVYFNSKGDEYIKLFNIRFVDKIRCFFRLKEYPGINFYKFSIKLNNLGIKTIKVKSYDKYSVITENLHGKSLDFHKNNKEILKKYFNIIKILYKNKIYSGDLTLNNFMVKNGEIYALDLEGFRNMTKNGRNSSKEFFRRFKRVSEVYNIDIDNSIFPLE